MKPLEKDVVQFITEKDGEAEKDFKNKLVQLFYTIKQSIRAYLVLVKYGIEKQYNVALCIYLPNEDKQLLNQIFSIFENMFTSGQHLDIIFLNDEKEIKIREVCLPFFVSPNYMSTTPDFYLTSSEGYAGYGLDLMHECFKMKKLLGSHPDGYLLCAVVPPLPDKDGGLGSNIDYVILAQRHREYSLFPVSDWPAYVHVCKVLTKNIEQKEYISSDDIKLIASGEIYKSPDQMISKKISAH